MSKIAKKKWTPREATTDKKIISIPRDNVTSRDYWMVIGEDHVTLSKQEMGSKPDWMIDIPRRDFDRFIDWYNTGRWGPDPEDQG